MDRGTGTLGTLAYLHINRCGGITPDFHDSFLHVDRAELSNRDLPFCLGVIPHRNSKDYSYSFASLSEDIITKKSSIPNPSNLSSIQYVKQVQWKATDQFFCFHPAFKDKNNNYLPIRLGLLGSIKQHFQSRDPPKRLGHHCAGGDLTVPIQHAFILIGELMVSFGSSFIVMNINSTESLMIGVYNPYVATKVTSMKTTSGKVRIGGNQMKMLFYDEFISCLYPREMVENFMSWKLKPCELKPPVKSEDDDTPMQDIHGTTAMDELLAAVTERESESENEDFEAETISNTSPSTCTPGTHSPLRSEPKFIDINASHLSYDRPPPQLDTPNAKIAKISSEHQISDRNSEETLMEVDIPPGRDHRTLKSLHIDDILFGESEIPSLWKFPAQGLSKFTFMNSILIRGVNFSSIPPEIESMIHLRYLTLSKNCIREIPVSTDGTARFPQSLELLDLSSNEIETFPSCNLPHLRYLNLQSNRLRDIADSFHQMNELSYVNMALNSLSEIPLTLKACTKLGTLLLSTNLVTVFPPNFFNGFSHLRRLDISRNRISDVENLAGLVNLRILDVSFNPLAKLPNCSMLEHLYILRCHYCALAEIPTQLPRNLQLFSIGRNSAIQSLPDDLFELKKLHQLDCKHIKLGELPSLISRLSYLQILQLGNTGISELPQQIEQLKYLTELDISENQFSELPEVVYSLISLRSLNASFNELKAISAKLAQLENLLQLDVSHNRIEELPSLQTLRQLSQLDVSNNSLSELHESVFSLPHLRFLYSSHNRFSSEHRSKIKKRFCLK